MDEVNRDNPPETPQNGGWVRRLLLPVAVFALAVVVTALLFVYGESISEVGGYLGSFLVSLVSNGTIILPVPGLITLFGLGASFNPWLIGITAGIGGAIGELTGYAAGFSGRGFFSRSRAYRRAVIWVRKWGLWVVFLFTVTPLPVDVIGIAAGALRFPVWKFLLVCGLGKAILYTGMAFAGRWGRDQFIRGLIDTETLWTVGGAIVAVVLVLVGALLWEHWTWHRD